MSNDGKKSKFNKDSLLSYILPLVKIFCSLKFIPIYVIFVAYLYYSIIGLYFVDEHYEGDKLRELSIDEKLTLIVVPPNNELQLKQFVELYSLCKPVYEVIIVWNKNNNPPIAETYFSFAHTHSKVKFFVVNSMKGSNNNYNQFIYNSELIDTQSECCIQ